MHPMIPLGICFLRSTRKEDDVSTDQQNHIKYRNEIFLPFVEKTRESYLRREGWNAGDEVDIDNIWVGWQVGRTLRLYQCIFTALDDDSSLLSLMVGGGVNVVMQLDASIVLCRFGLVDCCV